MRIFCLLFVLTLHLTTFGQTFKLIPVSLSNVLGSTPFYSNRAYTNISANSTSFKGVPLDIKEYRIKELSLEKTDNKLYIFYGLTKSDKRVIMFDSNFDKDFSKEKKYLFDYDVSYDKQKEESIVDTTSPVEIKLSNTPSIFVKPDVFNCCVRYGNPDDSIWHVFVETSYHREGSFEVNSKKFKIALLGNVSSYFTLNQTTFYLAPYSKSFEKQTNNNQPYRLRQSIFVDNQEFSVDSINEFGDTAWILYRGYNEKPFGSREGLYALNIQTISLNNHLFNLNQLKGNYVLLDFWGTWCNPCIELIPRLKALNNKYKSKGLQLISIAYDNKDSYEKLMHMIKEKEMNWTNIYDNRDMDNNICRQYDVICYPTSILINPNGKIIFRSCGENDFAKLEKLIAETIK